MSTQLSIDLLYQVKKRHPVDSELLTLKSIIPDALAATLPTDPERMVFWINVYNSLILLLLRENPSLYDERKAFFTHPRFTIAGQALSFDDIEHGILRRSKIKLSLGYVNKPLVSEFEKMMRVQQVDWRLHFALNCGADSCPPIEIYRLETLEEQLTQRAGHFLRDTSTYDAADNRVTVTSLMNYFRGDFGGISGIRKILKSFHITPEGSNPAIRFDQYNWTLRLEQFV